MDHNPTLQKSSADEQIFLSLSKTDQTSTEALVIKHFKREGQFVERDEPVVEVEADKTTFIIDSPVAGVLTQWLVAEGHMAPVSSPIAIITVAQSPIPETPKTVVEKDADLATDERLTFSTLSRTSFSSGKNDDYMLDGSAWKEIPLSARRKEFATLLSENQRDFRATLQIQCDWSSIERYSPAFLRHTIVAWFVARTAMSHPGLRTLWHRGALRSYEHIAVGIGVALPDDEMNIAVVPDADTLSFHEFVKALRHAVDAAREGEPASASPHVFLATLQPHNIISAAPIIVPPAVATLFIGTPCDVPARTDSDMIAWRRLALLSLAFDHRVMNGVGAATFLNDLAERLGSIPEDLYM